MQSQSLNYKKNSFINEKMQKFKVHPLGWQPKRFWCLSRGGLIYTRTTPHKRSCWQSNPYYTTTAENIWKPFKPRTDERSSDDQTDKNEPKYKQH